MDNKEYRGRGTVRMNPLGPHFYVDVDEGEKPPAMADLMTDTMNHLIQELDEEHGWNIDHAHIRGHVDITTAEWSPDDDRSGYGITLTVDKPEVSMNWYSRSPIHEFVGDETWADETTELSV